MAFERMKNFFTRHRNKFRNGVIGLVGASVIGSGVGYVYKDQIMAKAESLMPKKAAIVLHIPSNGHFDPKYSATENYSVHAPAIVEIPSADVQKAEGLENKEYLVMSPNSELAAKKGNYDRIGINVVVGGEIVSRGYNDVGKDVYIPMNDTIKDALERGKTVEYQGMALRKIKDGYNMVASYANGVLDKVKKVTSQAVPSKGDNLDGIIQENDEDQDNSQQNEFPDFDEMKNQTWHVNNDRPEPIDRNSKSLLEKYVSDRTINGDRFENSYIDEFNQNMMKAADQYNSSMSEGKSHFESLRDVVENADLAAFEKSKDASEALYISQKLGSDVTVKRWNSSLFDNSEVSSYISDLKGDGKTMNDIKSAVTDKYNHTISDTTVRKYLKLAA